MLLENFSSERIIDQLFDGLYFTNLDREIIFWNKAAERITGFTAEEVIGRSCSENILNHVDHEGNILCLGSCPLAATMADSNPREASVYLHHKKGHRVPVSVRTSILNDKDGKTVGGIELFTDISNNQANELRVKELEKLALLDDLTQLANRRYIEKELQSRFQEKKRLNVPFGVLFMDIDKFKEVNDTYGHSVGDEILILVANTFVSNSRSFDLFGRWGGDEFIGILRNIDEENLDLAGNRIRLLVKNSFLFQENTKLNVTLSIGATIVRESDTLEILMERIDNLLYKSKENGRNSLTIG
ncbi:MAG: sensor domain-containing diguanylate cyclase [Anaerolineaceae bacterium]|nr:sensor domain-containing diguanylate cyclase [Anaerolineaceae bacterium]